VDQHLNVFLIVPEHLEALLRPELSMEPTGYTGRSATLASEPVLTLYAFQGGTKLGFAASCCPVHRHEGRTLLGAQPRSRCCEQLGSLVLLGWIELNNPRHLQTSPTEEREKARPTQADRASADTHV
jgi:hypothetical protein